MTPRERLEKIMRHYKLSSYSNLANEIGLKRAQNLYDIRDGKIMNISGNLANKIMSRWPDISNVWLLTGEGEIIRGMSTFQANATIKEVANRVMLVPLIGQYAYAGYLTSYSDPEYLEHQPYEVITDQYTPGNYIAFEVRGDSMDDGTSRAIQEGDRVIGRELAKQHWATKFRKNEVYIIVHRTDGICIKDISEHDVEKGIITCHSWNPEYEDFQLHLNDILQIFYKKELRRS